MAIKAVLNILSDNPERENTILYLEDMTKSQLIHYMKLASLDPDHHWVVETEMLESTFEPKDYITTDQWLEEKGLVLSKSEKAKFAKLASKLYEDTYGHKPRKVIRPNDQGRYTNSARGYEPNRLDILQRAFEDAVKKPKVPELMRS